MNGETDVNIDETNQAELHSHCDLFALRNLLLAIDQARNEGYELNDVSLTEDRLISKILSHRLKIDDKVHLIGFITEDNNCFQQTLNTLEFCLKFKSCLSPEIGKNLNIKHDSSYSSENMESEEGEKEVTNSEGNHNHSSFSRGSDIKLSQHNSNVQQYNKNLVSNSPNMFETKRKKFSPRSQSDRHLSSMHMKSVKSQLIEANGSQNLIISENDIIKYLK